MERPSQFALVINLRPRSPWPYYSPVAPFPGGRGDPIGWHRGAARNRETSSREKHQGTASRSEGVPAEPRRAGDGVQRPLAPASRRAYAQRWASRQHNVRFRPEAAIRTRAPAVQRWPSRRAPVRRNAGVRGVRCPRTEYAERRLHAAANASHCRNAKKRESSCQFGCHRGNPGLERHNK